MSVMAVFSEGRQQEHCSYPQGSRMNLVGDDPEHAVVVPGGLLAPTAKAGLMAAIAGDEVAGGGAMAHPTVILAKGDVENPMQAVLDAPVPVDGPGQDGRIGVAVDKEIADLSLGLASVVN